LKNLLPVGFSPDGSLLAVTTATKLQIWEVSSGDAVGVVERTRRTGLSGGIRTGMEIAGFSSVRITRLILWQVLQ